MKSFGEYFKLVETLCESPLLIGDVSIIDSFGGAAVLYTKAKEIGTKIAEIDYNNSTIECLEVNRGDITTHIWIQRDGDLAVLYFVFQNKNGGIIEKAINQGFINFGVARFLYENYYIKVYDYIQSDITHTSRVKKFWYRLIERFLSLGYRITLGRGEEFRIENFNSYYTSSIKDEDNSFKVCRI